MRVGEAAEFEELEGLDGRKGKKGARKGGPSAAIPSRGAGMPAVPAAPALAHRKRKSAYVVPDVHPEVAPPSDNEATFVDASAKDETSGNSIF